MSHRPVILKLPFNILTASVVTRKEVRGHDDCGGDYLPAWRFDAKSLVDVVGGGTKGG